MDVEDSDDDFEAAVASIVEANLSVVRCLTAEDEEEMEDTEVPEAKERNKDRGRAEGHRRLMAIISTRLASTLPKTFVVDSECPDVFFYT